jgi:anti-sigma factor RsiW
MSSPLNEQDRADLVAYLDGELKGDAARALERKLTLDPAVRAEADALRRTWDLLDHLPRPEPSEDFTHRTLQRLAPVRRTVKIARRGWRRWAMGAGWAASVAAALGAGYLGGRAWSPREPGEQEMVRDLRVLENKRLYEAAEDLDFLRQLDHPDLFGDDAAGL